MPAEPKMIPNWNALEGKLLEGGYEVENCLSAGGSAASFKARILGDRFTSAFLRAFAPGTIAADQFALWVEAAQLKHPNLSSPLSVGQTEIDSAVIPYLVLRTPDETLDGVLKERAMAPEEAREILSSSVRALRFLHSSGWVHTALCPENILAIGDGIRLSTTQLRRTNTPATARPADPDARERYLAPESKTANLTPAADVFCLGATIFEILTRKRFAGNAKDEQTQREIAALPSPFHRIVQRSTADEPQNRCGLEDIELMLQGRQLGEPVRPAAPVTPPPAVSASSTPVAAVPVSAASLAVPAKTPATASVVTPQPPSVAPIAPTPTVPPVSRTTAPSVTPAAVRAPEPRPAAASARSTGRPSPELVRGQPRQRVEDRETPAKPWLWIFAGAIALAVLIWLFIPKRQTPVQPPVAATAAPQPSASQSGSAVPSHVATPADSSFGNGTRRTAEAAAPVTGEKEWRVVVYTFHRQADAEKRAAAIKAKHPAFDPEVFSPSGNGAPYLVVLNDRMSRTDAEHLKQKARSSGLPRDTYIQNYTR